MTFRGAAASQLWPKGGNRGRGAVPHVVLERVGVSLISYPSPGERVKGEAERQGMSERRRRSKWEGLARVLGSCTWSCGCRKGGVQSELMIEPETRRCKAEAGRGNLGVRGGGRGAARTCTYACVPTRGRGALSFSPFLLRSLFHFLGISPCPPLARSAHTRTHARTQIWQREWPSPPTLAAPRVRRTSTRLPHAPVGCPSCSASPAS